MHSENCPLVSYHDDSELPSVHSTINVSVLEEDLAISSSTLGNFIYFIITTN